MLPKMAAFSLEKCTLLYLEKIICRTVINLKLLKTVRQFPNFWEIVKKY